jgi:hypothetical protein
VVRLPVPLSGARVGVTHDLLEIAQRPAGVLFAALLAAAAVLLRGLATRPAAGGSHHEVLVAELAAGCGLAALLVLWSMQRVWRLSPGRQASRGSATFLPWSALTGVRETKRLFLLLDQEDRHVRGFIPKAGLAHLPPEVGIVRLIRDQITTGTLSAWLTPEERVAPQEATAVAHAGEQPAGGREVEAGLGQGVREEVSGDEV